MVRLLLCVKHKSDPPLVYCFFLSWDQLTSNSVATRCYYRSSASVCTPLNFLKGIYIMFFVTSYLSVLAELQFFLITLSICFTLIRDLSSLKFYLTGTQHNSSRKIWFSPQIQMFPFIQLNYCYPHSPLLLPLLFLLLILYVRMASLFSG